MTLREILEEKEIRLENVPEQFSGKVEQVQKQSLRELIALLDSLDREGSFISVSVENIAKIQQISEQLLSFIFDETEYTQALNVFSREFGKQAVLSRDYLSQITTDFVNKDIYKNTLRQSQKQAIELLSKTSVNQIFINPMKDVLLASISGGSSFVDTIQALTDIVQGTPQKEGNLLSHVKQVAFDGFAFSDRQYMKVVSEDVGFEWFQYFGGRIKDSRYFCVERAGQIFHKKEIEYWGETASLWDKPPGSRFHGGGRVLETNKTTIWTFAGGYNCRHQIAPVAESSVPKAARDRAAKLKFI